MTKNNRQRWGCIYKLTNQVNGKCYFGKTLDFKRRMNEHKCYAKKGKQYLSRAIRKHGWSSFKKEILIDDVPEEDLDMLEKSYIEIFDAINPRQGYNLTRGGDGSSGWVPSLDWRNKHTKRMILNSDQFGCITYNKKAKAYVVLGPFISGKRGTYIGRYESEEEAKHALEIFNKTGEKTVSTRTGQRQKKGSGGIYKIKHRKFRANFKHIYVGTYVSKEKAETALKHYIESGERLTSSIKKRTGTIRKYKSRFQALYRDKYIGTFSSKKEAEEAISNHLSTFQRATVATGNVSTTTSV